MLISATSYRINLGVILLMERYSPPPGKRRKGRDVRGSPSYPSVYTHTHTHTHTHACAL